MSDAKLTSKELVKSLRDYSEGPTFYWGPICQKAAEEIERLQRELAASAAQYQEACDDANRFARERDEARASSEPEVESPPVEVWNGDRKVTIYEDVVIRVWGPHIENEMSDEPRSHESVNAAIKWLYSSEPPRADRVITPVFMICNAYESGFGHGRELDNLPNPYSAGSDEHAAYAIGYSEGERRRRTNGSSGYCNSNAHELCNYINCMCKCHAPTKGAG